MSDWKVDCSKSVQRQEQIADALVVVEQRHEKSQRVSKTIVCLKFASSIVIAVSIIR